MYYRGHVKPVIVALERVDHRHAYSPHAARSAFSRDEHSVALICSMLCLMAPFIGIRIVHMILMALKLV